MAEISVFACGLCKPEGPVCLADGSWVVTEMGAGCLTWVSADGSSKRKIASTGRPNGVALDNDGSLWIAESRFPALLKVTMEGEVEEISRGSDDLNFLWPNDLCFGPDGALYLTDSGVLLNDFEGKGLPDEERAKQIDGRVFRVDPKSGKCECLFRGLRFANGIAVNAAGTHLYISETLTGSIYRSSFESSEGIKSFELFSNVMSRPISSYCKVAGPDGMAFDENGNLYVCVLEQGDVTVLDSEGKVKERIVLGGSFPTNIAFSESGESFAIVTEAERGKLLKVELGVKGLPLRSLLKAQQFYSES